MRRTSFALLLAAGWLAARADRPDPDIRYMGGGLNTVTIVCGDTAVCPFAGARLLPITDGEPIPRIHIRSEPGKGVLKLRLNSGGQPVAGLDPGRAEGHGPWRRLDLSRYAEPYGQTFWQKTTYCIDGDFWWSTHWVLEESDATRWTATNRLNKGTAPFPAALALSYEPDTAGNHLPMHEVLEIRASKRLWDVVPPVHQAPSPYAEELGGSIFIDLWGGHRATLLTDLLRTWARLPLDDIRCYTILQNWSTGGWDAMLPDSMRLPDYPPNPAVGTVADLQALRTAGRALGRFGFRTNYVFLRDASPSVVEGRVRRAVEADGTPRRWTRLADWVPLAEAAEAEIARTFRPDASFTDQLTSGASPWVWHDFDADAGSRSIRRTLSYQQKLAQCIRKAHGGPLSSESLIDQHLLGTHVDTGDYAIKNGHNRLTSPEYKLRRLHHLSTVHGMGLMYRFFEPAPFKNFHAGLQPYRNTPAMLDDYRCCEVLYGNGAYICYDFAPWTYDLTEMLLVGRLQRHYALIPVAEVSYRHNGAWCTLGDLVRGGIVPETEPWNPQTPAFGRVRVRYENGLTVTANRLAGPLTVPGPDGVPLTLPKSGWLAHGDALGVTAFSAHWPETQHRVDFLEDRQNRWRYLDPRGAEILGTRDITLWRDGQPVMTVDRESGTATCRDGRFSLLPATAPVVESRHFGFDAGLEGWRPTRGVLRSHALGGCWVLDIAAPDVYLTSPPLAWDAGSISALEVRMKIDAPGARGDGVFFTTDHSANIAGDKRIGLPIKADGRLHTYRIEMAKHPKWTAGHTVTRLRLDPIRGVSRGRVWIDSIRAVP